MKKLALIALFALFTGVVVPEGSPLGGSAVAQSRQLPDFADLAEKAGPAVVNIRTTERVKENVAPTQRPQPPEGIDENDPFFEFFRRFFPPNQRPQPRGRGPGDEVPRGVGSGFVISADGYIVTNNHVAGVAGKNGTIEVAFANGKTATGSLVGASPDYDLAVVKVDRDNLETVPLGRSSALRVGDTVIALGSPLGLQGTVTTGIVSALNRPVTAGGEGETAFIDAIQTDAAINPGNSGGPLVDATGAVIGVNSAIATMGSAAGQAGSIGLGFAIPIDTAKRVANEIIKNGAAQTPIIGVRLDMQFAGPGAKVIEVTDGGPAQAAGLRVDDIIVAVDGQKIADPTQAIVTIRAHAPGDAVTVSITRDGQPQDLRLTLQAAKPQ